MSLKRIFKKAIVTTAAALGVLGVGGYGTSAQAQDNTIQRCTLSSQIEKNGRPLTAGEQDAVRQIFGQAALGDMSRVKNYMLGTEPSYGNVLASACYNWIPFNKNRYQLEYYGTNTHSEDFNLDRDGEKYKNFIHEVTHTVQGFSLRYCKTYTYRLTATSRWSDFCREQQASIIEDYAGYFLHTSKTLPSRYMGIVDDELLAKVVEEQFPEARKRRLEIAAWDAARIQAMRDQDPEFQRTEQLIRKILKY